MSKLAHNMNKQIDDFSRVQNALSDENNVYEIRQLLINGTNKLDQLYDEMAKNNHKKSYRIVED